MLRAEKREKSLEADSYLAAMKLRKRPLKDAVAAGLSGDGSVYGTSRWIAHALAGLRKLGPARENFRRIVLALAECRSTVLDSKRTVWAVARVASLAPMFGEFVRSPEAFRPMKSRNPERQFALLLEHLFCRYSMTDVFDSAWFERAETHGLLCKWWLHLASGKNLRTAEGLPFALTRRAAHETLLAPVAGWRALCYARFIALGVSRPLAIAAANTVLSDRSHLANPYWDGLARFLAANPSFPAEQVVAVVDYVRQLPRDGDGWRFTFRGRSVGSVRRAVHDWHRLTWRRREYSHLAPWSSCGVPGMVRTEGEGNNVRVFRVTELLSPDALVDEGTAMRHCVGSYAWRCSTGSAAIFSITETAKGLEERLLTVELAVGSRRVVQARGKLNCQPGPIGLRVLRLWSIHAKVSIERT